MHDTDMRFERGPFGKIAVKTIGTDTDVILHAVDVLQNHVVPSILPVYIREQMGKIQLCIDCTGLLQLSEVVSTIWENQLQKKKCVADFLVAIVDAQDHFIDPALFVMESKFVFFDPESRELYWCCLPLAPKEAQQIRLDAVNRKQNDPEKDDESFPLPWNNFELLLMDPFFADVLDEDDRDLVLCLFRDECEDDLQKFLSAFILEGEHGQKPKTPETKQVQRLIIQLLVMAISLAVCMILESHRSTIAIFDKWSGWFVLIFTFILVISLMLGKGKKKAAAPEAESNDKESAKSSSRKDLYFPAAKAEEESYCTNNHTAQFSPAFLTRQFTSSVKGDKELRAVVWVDDFLIGRDKSLCDLFLDHNSISDRHARIIHRDPLYYLVDLGSSDGTWIGSRRLYSFEETPLNDGDSFTCGEIRFLFNTTL